MLVIPFFESFDMRNFIEQSSIEIHTTRNIHVSHHQSVFVITLYLANSCPSPPDLANSLKVPGGYTNGSLTVYTCVSGFASNGEDPYIICNGTQWTNTLFACSGEY